MAPDAKLDDGNFYSGQTAKLFEMLSLIMLCLQKHVNDSILIPQDLLNKNWSFNLKEEFKINLDGEYGDVLICRTGSFSIAWIFANIDEIIMMLWSVQNINQKNNGESLLRVVMPVSSYIVTQK